MSQKVLAVLSDFEILRLRWWAQFREHGGTAVPSSFPVEGPGGNGSRNGFNTARIPQMMGLTHDTEMAIDALPTKHALAVKLFWLFEGQSLRWCAAELRELLPMRYHRVEHRTFEVWVIKGHELLKPEFARARERWERQIQEAVALLTPEMQRIRVQQEQARRDMA